MALIAIPGERWEVEFFANGHVEVETFLSNPNGMEGEEALTRLFEENIPDMPEPKILMGAATGFWQRVQALEGETLLTLKQRKRFKILRVLPDRVEFVPEDGNETIRHCLRDDIERLADSDISHSEITVSRAKEEWPSTQNTSYLAAIAQAVKNGMKA